MFAGAPELQLVHDPPHDEAELATQTPLQLLEPPPQLTVYARFPKSKRSGGPLLPLPSTALPIAWKLYVPGVPGIAHVTVNVTEPAP